MPPTTRSQSQQEPYSGHDSDQDSDGSDDDDGRDTAMVVRSPITDISYDISNLDNETQDGVRQLFGPNPFEGSSQLVLQGCRSFVDGDSHFYAFEMHETVRRPIRVGSPKNQYRKPKCFCMGDSEKPCKHLIYLLDQVNFHTADHQSGPPEHLGPDGYASEMGHPFERISEFHLDQLASSLHCDLKSPDFKSETNPAHLQDAREILASVAEPDLDDYAFERFRPDIFDNPQAIPGEDEVISYGDLTRTVANMLLDNKEFFAYFLRLLEPSSRARDPFRKIQQRVDRVLGDLAAFARDTGRDSTTTIAMEGHKDVPWAAAHVERAVSTIHSLLQNRSDAPSAPTERASAARALVRILFIIVFDWNREIIHLPATTTSTSSSGSSPNPAQTTTAPSPNETNLYHRLIGGRTHGSSAFVIDVLAQLPEQNQWIETLEEIEDRLSTYAPPAGYVSRLREVILSMRSSRPAPAPEAHMSGPSRRGGGNAAGSKRSRGGGNGREGGAKRVK
ncbi:hypothetical protein N8I77_003890 [Diaporthe amygdali]|uniref:SWIM-type domain-containing protein n=1 Tax=Phomopsis amygdali TaxID=1214568 RepID=A0AAD9W798_PHOAM|nr:hypothetical protein N8I77_003890 [Diaporthe amygdali]